MAGGAGSGDRGQETLLIDAGRLWVQLPALGSAVPHFLGVVDLATESLLDADPQADGTQPVVLQGTGPRFKMQRIPGARAIAVSATGSFHDEGGLERVDVDTLLSSGVAVREWFDVSGNDIGAFAMLDADRGWLAFSTDIVLSSHLHPFTFSGGGLTPEVDNSLFYFAPHLLVHVGTDTLFWPKPEAVQAFDATTGDPRTLPLPLGGAPTDMTLLAAACHNGVDDDGDALIDFDGGLSVLGVGAPGVTEPDPHCVRPDLNREGPVRGGCGLGAGLALPLLGAWRRRIGPPADPTPRPSSRPCLS